VLRQFALADSPSTENKKKASRGPVREIVAAGGGASVGVVRRQGVSASA